MLPATLRDDLRALGWGAPVRVAYEAGKRVGAHQLVLGPGPTARVTRRDPGLLLVPIALPDGPPAALERTMVAAREIVDGRVVLFGRTVDLGPRTDWHRSPDTGAPWPSVPWWTIDIRSATPGEIKQVWELGRARHLVVLARAASPAGATHDPATAEAARARLEADLGTWFDQNPPETGIHWYSNLELSLRVLVWLEVLARVPDLDPTLVDRIRATLPVIARHQLVELPYTLSTMRNNHLLGDALGMVAIGLLLPHDRWAARAGRVGRRLWARQLDRQVRSDGSMIEDSVSYHRFVVEMLAWRVLLDGDPATREALGRAAGWLVRLGVLDGPVPQLGDWDEGRLLATTQVADDLTGATLLGLALVGGGAPAPWRDGHDECAWYAGEGQPAVAPAAAVGGDDLGGGVARTTRGSLTVWLKAGSGPSHGHADLCSLAVHDRDARSVADGWLVADPGTGTYNGPLEVRTWFRSSVAHAVLRVETPGEAAGTGPPVDDDQLGAHRAFRWRRTARGRVGPPVHLGDGRVVLWGAHDAYRGRGGRVARAVVVGADGLDVTDWVEEPGGLRWRLSLPLPPGVVWDGEHVATAAGTWRLEQPAGAALAVHRGEREPFDGWWSHTLEQWEPATRLALDGRLSGPVRWGLHRARGDAPVPAGELHLDWSPEGAALTVADGPATTTAYLVDLPEPG